MEYVSDITYEELIRCSLWKTSTCDLSHIENMSDITYEELIRYFRKTETQFFCLSDITYEELILLVPLRHGL